MIYKCIRNILIAFYINGIGFIIPTHVDIVINLPSYVKFI